jgi:(S)-ureidoglycine aminohydrolase
MEVQMSSTDFVPFDYSVLGGTRAVYRDGICLVLPRVFRVDSWLPNFKDTDVFFLASAELGAGFEESEYQMKPGGGTRQLEQNGKLQAFLFVLEGAIDLTVNGKMYTLDKGGYAWIPPGSSYEIKNSTITLCRFIRFRRNYIKVESLKVPDLLISNEKNVATIMDGTAKAQMLLPFEQDRGFDAAFNILTFDPSVNFDRSETHIFEHGAYFLTGRGLFWINGVYHDVREDDFVYFAPYIPHFVGTWGDTPLSYLLYKNINRDVVECQD